ncbi:MAG TPA: ferritin-like domain-containing protein [Pseudobdellovibrionaceae bacterium]
MSPIIDIENLGFDMGAHLLVKRGLAAIPVGSELLVKGSAANWQVQLSAWCREQGHSVRFCREGEQTEQTRHEVALVCRGSAESERWTQAEKTGFSDVKKEGAVAEEAQPNWGLAARGATTEAGGPAFHFRLNKKTDIWASNASELYAHAVAAQWDPEKAIVWSEPRQHSQEMEDAVIQVMTYMIENENAALLVPARFLGQLHPHFREVQALLAIQVADEARHIEVFTRRIRLYGGEPAVSTAGGQASLKTLLDEPDFSVAGFLLSILGEGTFVDLLQFMHQYAPDAVTRQMCLLAARDEARHVSFGMSHLREHLEKDPMLQGRLRTATEARFEGLAKTSGLNAEVFDSLILIAAGECTPAAIAQGFQRVQNLLREMENGRRSRLEKLGFTAQESQRLASLHTRNFM